MENETTMMMGLKKQWKVEGRKQNGQLTLRNLTMWRNLMNFLLQTATLQPTGSGEGVIRSDIGRLLQYLRAIAGLDWFL